jgi:methionyl-tRNA formyltransferase
MNNLIDGGNILKQRSFTVDKDETALSLNIKCYTHALEAFKALIQDLSIRPLAGEEQDLNKRSYFGYSRHAPHFGFLSFSDSAEDVYRLYRALFFGDYPNTIASFKISLNNKFFIPRKLDVLLSSSKESPGTIIKITEQFIYLSTKTYDISISELSDLDGKAFTINMLIKNTGIGLGQQLENLDKKKLKNMHNALLKLNKHEEFWSHELRNISTVELPFTSTSLGEIKPSGGKLLEELPLSPLALS